MYLSAHPLDRFKLEIETFANTTIARLDEIERTMQSDKTVQNKEYIVTGLVTECETRYTKDNRPWCRFTLEDYTGSHTFSLFSKDYETFMKYTQVHTSLLIKCSVKPRYRKRDEAEAKEVYELRLVNMVLLSNAKDDFVKEIRIALPLSAVTPALSSALVKELKHHKGKARLYVDLSFTHDGMDDNLSLFSRKFSLTPSYELFAFLDKNNLRHRMVTKVEL
jgi:DNA polymerase-3 subunit alpha